MMSFDEAAVRCVLPDRQPRAGRPPCLERLGVRPAARPDPLEQVEDQAVDGVGHATIFTGPRAPGLPTIVAMKRERGGPAGVPPRRAASSPQFTGTRGRISGRPVSPTS